jgi:hypothetical protein
VCLFAAYRARNYWHIDGSDSMYEGTWVSWNGAPMTYNNWQIGEPNHYDGIEHCIHIQTAAGYRWYDGRCDDGAAPFICQIR